MIQAALSLARDKKNKPYYQGRIDGRYGPKTSHAIACVCAERKVSGAPVVRNGSPLLRNIVEVADKELRKKPTGPKPSLTFDGKSLCWKGAPHNGKCWKAASGAIGFQEPEHQSIKDKGPIPEGAWIARQDRYQRYDDIPWYKKLISMLPSSGEWPGGTIAWGRHRIWLEPKAGTNVLGRSGFSIHGGSFPGSIGCIDLTSSMSDFAKKFVQYGVDIEVTVKYK